ncbi:hypothetical protein DS2_00020 [Catenovulum agarivorans DS-2]|uniref:Uncharacterized protein n=1 Tax=Catenovulum agarivorans DS-2 TaxID=1328313 RepID=W7QST0_9ALTE|nr:hypothetical protein [Catenovulum agarivorans]EWH12062.1 hypothetical protein DS2_00020 [Catenovulum agarivorans DS-2]
MSKQQTFVLLILACLAGCSGQQSELEQALSKQTFTRTNVMYNEAAYVPAQCYTKTQDEQGNSYNSCYACHANGKRPNYINGTDLQLEYGFTAEYLQTNRWKNVFRDFSAHTQSLTDEAILSYVRESNYFSEDGEIVLAKKLKSPPKKWDANNNGKWDGFIPDVMFNFDQNGFDRTSNGEYTGWRVFAYAPFPGAFMPTNGATDDVMIRLPSAFQQNAQGNFDIHVYQLNLAIVEALIQEKDISIPVTDEQKYQVDLDKNGELSIAQQVTYKWAPKQDVYMYYVGKAGLLQQQDKVKAAAGLFPVGSEFLHTVRYLDLNEQQQVQMSARIKEVRYSKKVSWNTYAQLQNAALSEIKEKHDFPDRLRTFKGDSETGLYTGLGWKYQAFIEDKQGDLRPQTYEETVFCMGCHSGISATTDLNFSFARKLNNQEFKNGWYHWNEKSIAGTAEPQMADGRPEFATYLKNNPWGDEFRTNQEVYNKFFDNKSQTKSEMFDALQHDLSVLMLPSPQRAVALNKAYHAIVQEQSYIWGRTPLLAPTNNVHQFVESGTPTGLEVIVK